MTVQSWDLVYRTSAFSSGRCTLSLSPSCLDAPANLMGYSGWMPFTLPRCSIHIPGTTAWICHIPCFGIVYPVMCIKQASEGNNYQHLSVAEPSINVNISGFPHITELRYLLVQRQGSNSFNRPYTGPGREWSQWHLLHVAFRIGANGRQHTAIYCRLSRLGKLS